VKLNMIYHQAKYNRDVAVDAQQQLQEYAERIRTLEAELEEAGESLKISQGKQAQLKRASRRMSQELNALKESGGVRAIFGYRKSRRRHDAGLGTVGSTASGYANA